MEVVWVGQFQRLCLSVWEVHPVCTIVASLTLLWLWNLGEFSPQGIQFAFRSYLLALLLEPVRELRGPSAKDPHRATHTLSLASTGS